MNKPKNFVFAGIFVISMIALVVYLGPGGRNYEFEGLFSFHQSGYKIWAETMQRYGHEVEETKHIPSSEEAPDTAIFFASFSAPHEDLTPMLDYVHNGGKLIIRDNFFDDDPYIENSQTDGGRLMPYIRMMKSYSPECDTFETYQVHDVTLDGMTMYPPTTLYDANNTQVDSTVCFPIDAREDGNANLAEENQPTKEEREDYPGVVTINDLLPTSYAMVKTTFGKGEIIRVSSYDFMQNGFIVNDDNGVFAYRLFEGRHKLLFMKEFSLKNEKEPEAQTPFPAGHRDGLLFLYFSYFLFLWAAILRPGQVVSEPLLERRQAHESTVVIGEMLRTSKNFKMASTVLQKQVRKDASRRTGIPETEQAELIAAVRAQTNMDPELIATLLYRDVVNSNEEYVTFAKSITTLRKLLKAVAQGRY